MEWLFKFAEKDENEKAKIIFHLIKFFIVSTFSFIIYRYLFGDFIINDLTFKNAIDFINSEYLFFSALAFVLSWLIYWLMNKIQKQIAYFFSSKLKIFFSKHLKNELSYKNVKRIIKFSNLLLTVRLLKLENNRISFSKQLISAKDSLTESQDKKNESEKTYYIMSACFLLLGLEVFYYTGVYIIILVFSVISIYSFIIAMFFSFSLRNSSMMLAIIKSIKNFTERYEYNRDSQ